MDLNDDDSDLIMKNILLFTSLLEDKDVAQKISEIEDILKSGADVNAADAENNYDTPLHVAIRSKQKDIVKLLLQWNADITRLNGDDRSALYIARGLGGVNGKDIKDMLEEHAKKKNITTSESTISATGLDTIRNRIIRRADTIELSRYLKRDGTTGVGGQLYKTKTLSLVLLRASNDKDILEDKFYLGTNLPGTGAFYDICFKYNLNNSGKSIRLFMQCKHLPTQAYMTETDLRNADGDWSLPNCYDSFLKIKDKFGSDINDPIFGEDYNNVETNFVIYTSSKANLKSKFYGNTGLSPKIHYLINTGENTTVFRFNYTEEDIDLITKEVQKRRMASLAHRFINFIFTDKNIYNDLMEDKLIKTYHVALAQNVLQISGSEAEGFRKAVLRPEFFQNADAFSVILKEALCKLTVRNYCNKSHFGSEELVNLFKQLPNVPSCDEISMFIGYLLKYDEKNNKLILMNDLSQKGFSNSDIQELAESLEQIYVPSTTVKDAILKAGEHTLSSTCFKVPSSFGNIDMSIDQHDKVFDNIVSVFAYLFNYYRNTKIIELNETNVCKFIKSNGQVVTTEFLQNEKGIGSAIGNLLVLDNETTLLKFNTTSELPKKAKTLLQKLRLVLPRMEYLENYRLKINFHGCPRISFMNNDYDKTLAKYFLGRLWFYTDQKTENKIDDSVKKEINKYYNAHNGPAAFGLCTHIDSIYSTFHDEIQKWWMVTPEYTYAPYISQDSEIFRIAQEGVIDNPLLTLHHQIYLSKMKKTGIEFTADAVMSLELGDVAERLVNIKTDCAILTGIKIQQYYNNKTNYNFIDLDYMLSLPMDDRHAIINELKHTTVDTLIVVCGLSKSRKPFNEDLHRVINMFKGEKVIVVTENGPTFPTILRILPTHYTIKDEMNDFIHVIESSQENLAKDTTLIFQGKEISLNNLLDETSLKFINAKLLSKLMNNERIEIGHILTNKNYEDIQNYYAARCLEKEGSEDSYPVNSLDDIKDQVVVLITRHGMGKSTLLTHIALESKKAVPTRWIVRINLADYSNYFYGSKGTNKTTKKVDALNLLCIASLKHIDEKTVFELVENENKIILGSCAAQDPKIWLELQLFLHYYNERKITFLFYGFDYVCPPFGKEVIKMLKVIQSDGVTMWVTSHLVAIPKQVLEKQFGPSYNLQPIDETGQMGFFYKFWKSNLQLEKINSELFSNIWDFFEYMSGKRDIHKPQKNDRIALPFISMPLHMLYLMAVKFFQTELSNFSFEHVKKKFKQYLDIDLNTGSTLGSYIDKNPEAQQAAELAGTPLYMYIAANYFHCKIKGRFQIEPNTTEIKKKWDLWQDAVGLYKQFLQHNMSKVCSQCDGLNVDEDQETDKRMDFFEKHKKLALLAICREEDLDKLLPADEIDDLKNTIRRIQSGEEKSAFVDCVFNNVPRFFHIMYAEYCAIEILTDLLKNIQNDSMDQMRFTVIWDFIVNIFLYSCSNSVRSTFDYKLKNDPHLSELTSSDHCKNIIFELLVKPSVGRKPEIHSDGKSPLQVAVDSGMNNLVKLFLMSLDVNLTRENVKSFMKLFETVDIALHLHNICGGNTPTNVTQFFADMRLDKFVDVVKSERTIDLSLKVLSIFGDSDVVNGARDTLITVQQRLLDRVADNFGLSEDNIDLFRHLAEKIRQHSNSYDRNCL